jgi:hypothetical protein
MNLFGCKFCSTNKNGTITKDRKNFDSLLWATITVFQVSFAVIINFFFSYFDFQIYIIDNYSSRLE